MMRFLVGDIVRCIELADDGLTCSRLYRVASLHTVAVHTVPSLITLEGSPTTYAADRFVLVVRGQRGVYDA